MRDSPFHKAKIGFLMINATFSQQILQGKQSCRQSGSILYLQLRVLGWSISISSNDMA